MKTVFKILLKLIVSAVYAAVLVGLYYFMIDISVKDSIGVFEKACVYLCAIHTAITFSGSYISYIFK